MRRIGKVSFILGCLLIAGGLTLLLVWQTKTKQAVRSNAEIVQTMERILPERRQETQDPGWTIDMPALEIGGEDFIALLEIPAYGLKLPVCGVWDKDTVVSHPCRFCGTAYNGSLVLGGSDQPGQFDFFDVIQNGADITVTDMTGGVFSYVVERVDRSDSAQAEILADAAWDLTLFVRDAQLLEYIILRCVVK